MEISPRHADIFARAPHLTDQDHADYASFVTDDPDEQAAIVQQIHDARRTSMTDLSPHAAANLERAARDLDITPAELLERLAQRVEVGRAGRICLAGEDEE